MPLQLKLRRRLNSRGIVRQSFMENGSKLAILVIDVWDSHWCSSAAQRMDKLAVRLNLFLKRMRRCGVKIIHAPGGVTGKVAEKGARLLSGAAKDFPVRIELHEPEFPLDNHDHYCASGEWPPLDKGVGGQHPALEVFSDDYACDDGLGVRQFLMDNDIVYTLLVGVHANMCLLDAPCGAREMARRKFNVAVVRDMVDILYNPAMPPRLPRLRAFVLTLRHIETFICPTISSRDIVVL